MQGAPDSARSTAAAARRPTKYGDDDAICFRAEAGVGFGAKFFFSGANMTRLSMRALFSLSLVAVPLAASAHHSIQAQFDIYKTIQVTGTVARIEFINPHSYLTVNVKEADGKVTKWAFEMTGLAGLRRAGLSRADRGGLKAGDALTVIALAARDGTNSGLAQELKMGDGRVFKLLADAPDAPAATSR